MENPFKNTWELYTGQFEKILVLMLTTTLPLLLAHSYVMNYIYLITPSSTGIYSVADIYYGLITLLFFLYAQVPYIRFVYNEHLGVEHNLRNTIYHFVVNGFTIFVFACLISILSTIGFALLILPGIIILSLVFPVPYISVFDEKSTWKSFKEGFRIGRKHFFKIFLLLILIGFAELLFGVFVTYQLFNITPSFAAQMITQMSLNIIIYPFVIMLMTSFILKWRNNLRTIEVKREGNFI
ncbi:hypothetical protein [Tenuibacillus multivorans]|uniref:Membrane domain of glycerophosphoryl diester phosphodiesterase n=1 Tax=Tenuibacillus multivorans TaxID=237069 RepID=A0A1G9WHK2_9BACI|nr:hypothetical protein [Tenuibacillus multivorans]GEL76469.1 hypothetical protein TMU01_07040 [Tenuibacillus multivorans]SDM84018.1 hypothetical protein SAMN05216498_0756 [Tenuibacillus multivorans]